MVNIPCLREQYTYAYPPTCKYIYIYIYTYIILQAPRKMHASVLVECARLEEYEGHLGVARRVLESARKEAEGEWKVRMHVC